MTEPRATLHPAFWIVPAVLLLVALVPLPYGFYRLLRLVVCVCCGVIAYRTYDNDGFSPWAVALGFLVLLFNPFVPIHLSREVWAPIDLASSVFLFVHFALSPATPNK